MALKKQDSLLVLLSSSCPSPVFVLSPSRVVLFQIIGPLRFLFSFFPSPIPLCKGIITWRRRDKTRENPRGLMALAVVVLWLSTAVDNERINKNRGCRVFLPFSPLASVASVCLLHASVNAWTDPKPPAYFSEKSERKSDWSRPMDAHRRSRLCHEGRRRGEGP